MTYVEHRSADNLIQAIKRPTRGEAAAWLIAACFSRPSEELNTRPQSPQTLLVGKFVIGMASSGCVDGKIVVEATALRMESELGGS